MCWWVPAGHVPTVDEAARAPRRLRATRASATTPSRSATAVPPPSGPTGSVVGRMERFGLVGLPNAGKSSLYNALTGGGALAAPYAFATKDPNIGVAKVPDERLDRLAEMSKSRNVVHAAVQVVDIGGLVEGASKGEGLGNKFLANIREVDAVVFVLRAFEDDDVTGPVRPDRAPPRRRAGAGAGRPGDRREAPRTRPSASRSWTARSATSSPPCRRPYDALSDGRPLYRAGLKPEQRERAGAALPADQPPRARRRQRRRGRPRRDPRGRGPHRRRAQRRRRQRRGHRDVRAAGGRGRVHRGPRRAGRDARGLRARRGRAVPHGPQRLPPARPAHVPHHRRQGDRGRGRSTRARRRRSAPGGSTPTSSAASSGPR